MSTNFPAPRDLARDPEHPLARAFASFTEAAGSLERTYGQLQGQVGHLRHELEVTNRDLATSLDENHRIRERLRRIVEGLPCGVLVVEAGSTISTLNPEAARLLGGSFDSADGLPGELSEALDQARQTGVETELQLSHSSPVWIAVRHAWLEQYEARATSVFILRDVSEAKKLECDREHLQRQQALVEMSALLAHEIRNPLGSLELFAGLLAESNLEGESRRWIEHVQAGLRTLSATVNNVLHLHNTPEAELAPTDAGQLLDWAYDFLLPLAKQARVEMQTINGLRGVTIQADRHRLEQVLLNLAINAFRFMPGGGWLSIRGADCAPLQSSGQVSQKTDLRNTDSHNDDSHNDDSQRKGSWNSDCVEISVCDTGPGIAPEDISRIFDAGFSTRAGSSGLGLAVCRRILEQHAGSISAESRPGHGATFRLRLPRDGGAPASAENVLKPAAEYSSADVAQAAAGSGAAL
jgi:two-component system sensor histidine kinase FlrB